MKKYAILAFVGVMLAGCGMFGRGNAPARTEGLRVNRQLAPAHVENPVFSWKMVSERPGAAQTAYRLRVETPEGRPVWDSGEIAGGLSAAIPYTGPALMRPAVYRWSVQVKDEKGTWLAPAWGRFTTAMDVADWEGSYWISADRAPVKDAQGTGMRAASGTSWFVKDYFVTRRIVSAWWTVTGLGVFEVYVNGRPVARQLSNGGEEADFLKPGFTHVQKCRRSFTYDVLPFLNGEIGAKNTLAAEVSAGWWRDQIVQFHGKRSAFRGVLQLTFDDGTSARVCTGVDWRAGVAGPVRAASIFEGETYDAREPFPCVDSIQMKPAVLNTEFSGEIRPNVGAGVCLRSDLALAPRQAYAWKGVTGAAKDKAGTVTKTRTYAPAEEIAFEPGETVVIDFGQNAAAVPEFVFSAAADTILTVRTAEMLNDGAGARSRGNDGPEGSVYRANLRGAPSAATYTFAGRAREEYRPRFTFFGYRYLSLTATAPVRIHRVRSIPVTSIARDDETGTLETGVPELNRLVSNVRWGQYSNYLSVPTDCPQRNERLGWTADTQVFCETAAYNADVYAFFMKWMDDMTDSQGADGGFPSVAPFAQYGNETRNLGWADAGIIVPYTIWRHFGDPTILSRNWEAMKRFMKLVDGTKYKWNGKQYTYADWLSYETFETCGNAFGSWKKWANDPDARAYREFLAACYWHWDAARMAEMAEALGRKDEAVSYRDMARRALDHIRATYVDPKDGLLLKSFRELQTACLFALRFNVVQGPAAYATRDLLFRNIREHGDCLQTGFLGTSILMDTLTYSAEAPELAYTLLLQRKNPSWLYSVDQGATTIWERWNSYRKDTGFGPVGMNSFNHYAYGAVLAWMYGTMAGIQEDVKHPGFKHFTLAPIPDARVGHVTASFDSPYGLITSAWRISGSTFTWTFTIPANTTATVVLPGGAPADYSAGTYTLSTRL